jgi:hypothetical protein
MSEQTVRRATAGRVPPRGYGLHNSRAKSASGGRPSGNRAANSGRLSLPRFFLFFGLLAAVPAAVHAYPLDGYEYTGIRRLLAYRLALEGKVLPKPSLAPGAMLNSDQVQLRLNGVNDIFDLDDRTPRDPYLQQGLERIFADRDPSYGIAVLDITDPNRPLYGSLRADTKRIPGSVGKLFVATGFFDAVARAYPADTEARARLMRETILAADRFVHRDGKTVPFYNDGDPRIISRRLEIGDKFNLWEWLDHMLSVSSNAAGSMVWKEAMMIRHFGARYPLRDEEAAFLKETPRVELGELAMETVEEPLTSAGLDTNKIRIGTFFTGNASSAIPGSGSYASPNELMRWLIKLEQGKLVDRWSSLELKKLLYFSRPRYRYASSPALNKAAVFFKSGSLFHCKPEPGFTCRAYAGNELNLMHSVAVVESGEKVYLVTMMSNVLRLNSAVEHQKVATDVERLLQSRPAPETTSH